MRADIAKLDRAFNARCIAVVGDSGPLQWLRAHLNFKGKLWSVHLNPRTIEAIEKLGVENRTRLVDISDPVDLAIVSVSREAALRVLDDCIRKEVAAAHFFTAGFAETGTDEGIRLEQLLRERAEQANFHLIGPNCMGIFNPGQGLKQIAGQYDGAGGPVGFISQSGTHAITMAFDGHLQGLDINKSVSFGNGTVLDSAEFLDYFGRDDAIKVIGMYLEGVKDGKRFLEVLRGVSSRKPVAIWKGGRTAGGDRAIASHTGSLATPHAIWEAAVRQAGAINVKNQEELIDTLKTLVFLPLVRGRRVGIAGGSGGQSVAITDAFMEAGLEVPPLTRQSYDELASFFSLIGGGYGNPIDTGNSNRAQLTRILEIVERDANVDSVVMLMGLGMAGGPQDDPPRHSPGQDEAPDPASVAIALRQKAAKPVLAALSAPFSPGVAEEVRRVTKKLQDGGVPAFVGIERAAAALKNALDYHSYRLHS